MYRRAPTQGPTRSIRPPETTSWCPLFAQSSFEQTIKMSKLFRRSLLPSQSQQRARSFGSECGPIVTLRHVRPMLSSIGSRLVICSKTCFGSRRVESLERAGLVNYCTGTPLTGMWSSVMKTTLQRMRSKMCGPSSGSGGRPVSRTVISRPQFGQVGFCSMTDKRLDGTKFRRREGYPSELALAPIRTER